MAHLYRLSTRSSAIFLYVVHSLRLLLLALFRKQLFYVFMNFFSAFPGSSGAANGQPGKTESTSVRVGFFY
jgi:hypothetical protein